ncbi:MAG: AbrB/MazE/SpoVT family DNA-binding domain-containing protein [Actinobacteria bacterium]|nr:AbrB/MazE/SpoVT family DNA-binding domain-containing protein [Actinomycetota bacterium]
MKIAELTPQSGSYRGNRSVCGLERALPADWLWRHDFCGDEVEVYAVGDALVLRPSREAQPKATVNFRQLTVGWCPVEWWRIHDD